MPTKTNIVATVASKFSKLREHYTAGIVILVVLLVFMYFLIQVLFPSPESGMVDMKSGGEIRGNNNQVQNNNYYGVSPVVPRGQNTPTTVTPASPSEKTFAAPQTKPKGRTNPKTDILSLGIEFKTHPTGELWSLVFQGSPEKISLNEAILRYGQEVSGREEKDVMDVSYKGVKFSDGIDFQLSDNYYELRSLQFQGTQNTNAALSSIRDFLARVPRPEFFNEVCLDTIKEPIDSQLISEIESYDVKVRKVPED